MRKILLGLFLIYTGSVFGAGVVGPGTNQSANTVLAGPSSGAPAQPTYRVLVTADFPSNVINGASIQNTSLDLTSKVTGALPIANGGTGATAKQAAFDALDPFTTKGDLIGFDGTHNGRLGVGTDNFVLTADSTATFGWSWKAAGAGAAFSTLTGGTNTAAAMVVGTGASLTTSGSGTITANAYNGTGNINASTALTNKVPLANGGTNADLSATGGAGQFLRQNSTGAAITVATIGKTDCPATTAFTDNANTFTSVQSFNNYVAFLSNTPAQITSDQTGFDPGAGSYVRISSDALRNIQGIANGVNGRLVDFINVGASNIVLANQNASATAANRIICPTGADMTLQPNYGAQLVYDSTDSRWRVLSIFQVNGGGLTVPSGTSGGVPYYSAGSTISSSAALTQNALVLGGGAGGAPSTPVGLGTTTTVLHGNAGGAPTWGQIATGDIAANAVDMSSKMTGTMLAAQMPALTGDVTNTAGSLATTIANNAVTTAKINANAVDMATKMTGTMLAAQFPALTGDVTTSAGSLATTIANLAVTNAKIANGTIDLTAKVTGILPIANGGTAASTQQGAIDNIAGSAAKGAVLVYNGTHWVQLPVGSDNQVLTALAASTNGVTWGAAGGATVIAPMAISGGSVAFGTCVAGTTSDANSSIVIGSAGTTKKVAVFQTVATNTAPAIEVQKSDGTVQWQIDNSTTSRTDITEKLQTANQANIQMQSITETITLASAATTTTATNLIPANSYVVGVTARVVTASIAGVSTYSLGISGNTSLFVSGASATLGQTSNTLKQTPPLAPFTNSSASTIVITPSSTPTGGNTGQLRITVFYFTLQEPQN